MFKDWPDPLPDTIPGEGVVREVELLQVPKDWSDPLPDTIPGEGVVREVELLQVPEDWHYSDKCLVVQLTVREVQDLIAVCGEEIVFLSSGRVIRILWKETFKNRRRPSSVKIDGKELKDKFLDSREILISQHVVNYCIPSIS
jgi:hypothetical protein